MTLIEAVTNLDIQKNNPCSMDQKIRWLSELDVLTRRLLFGDDQFVGYDQNTKPEIVLQIPAPFDDTYGFYLESRVDYANGDFTRFNNANAMFRAAWQRYADYCNRTGALPKNTKQFT